MSDVAIFGFGSVMFIATTWATIAFGVRRVHELQDEDLKRAGRAPQVEDGGLTELHVELDADSSD